MVSLRAASPTLMNFVFLLRDIFCVLMKVHIQHLLLGYHCIPRKRSAWSMMLLVGRLVQGLAG